MTYTSAPLRTAFLCVLAGCSDGSEDPQGSSTSSICERYIACAAATSPVALPELQRGYGVGGSCWAAGDRGLCEQACQKGLSQLRPAADGAAECGCLVDADCLEPDRPYCDAITRQCGECKSSDECEVGRACVRSPRKGARCASCYAIEDGAACGVGYRPDSKLWSDSPFCSVEKGPPTCFECYRDEHCGPGGVCNLSGTIGASTGRCAAPSNCTGVWQCLRNAPVECSLGGTCCSVDRCPSVGPYVECMNERCAACSGKGCVDCSIANCKSEYGACKASCR